jgi:argininosuccinate synthase
MESDASAYDQSDATGFIQLNALRLKVRAAMKSSPGVTKD